MIIYIVTYSVIIFLLLAATVVACVFYVRGQKSDLSQPVVRNAGCDEVGGVFTRIYGEGGAAAFILTDAETLQPVFISPNINNFFGATADEICRDTHIVGKAMPKEYVRAFGANFANWDRSGIFEQEFGYGKDKFGKAEAFSAQCDGRRFIAFSFTDITDQRKQREEMQKNLDAALEQAAAKSSFLSSMSHEIRTPMNGVMGMMSLARMNIDDKEKVVNYLERAEDLSVFLLGMINDILDISKIESGKMQLYYTHMDVFAFAGKIRNMFTGTITDKGINFLVETVGFTERWFECDELRLTQVVTNLVSNASKFTPAGGNISVTFKQLDKIGGKTQLMIRVRDSGKGIAPENIRKIMRPFEQEEASTAHNYGGTGLGLAICDNIVRLMGGNIVIDSTLGKGTDFSVYLSLEVSDVVQDMTEPLAVEQKQEEVDFSWEGCRVLLAEDNEVNAEIAIEILESEGAVVTHAVDGRDAVDKFIASEIGAFDLVLLDIQMPRLNGRQAAQEIRKSGRADAESVPLVALSADAFVEDVKLSEAAGMDGHVSKPIDFDELKKRAGEIINAKRKEGSTGTT